MSPPSDQDRRPREADTARGGTPATAADSVEVVLPAEWVAPSVVRDRIRAWLAAHRWSPTHQQDLVLAVSEAVSNSVEHGYGIDAEDTAGLGLTASPDTIEVRGRILIEPDGSRRAEITVRDRGRWSPPPACHGNRGHGMTLMRAGADEVTVSHGAGGTTILLRSRRLPPPLRAG